MQDYGNPKSRNVSIAAGQVGSNQSQGKGELPSKVSVPFPGSGKPQGGSGGVKKNPPGFGGGLIPGKI